MVEMVLMDIDGTLRDEAKGIPATAVKAVRLLKQKNCLIAVCTGRSRGTIPDDVLALRLDCIIAGGGNHIEYRGRILKEESFSGLLMEEVSHRLERSKTMAYTFETRETVFMNEAAASILKARNRKKKRGRGSFPGKAAADEKIGYEANMEQFHPPGSRVHKICIWALPEEYGPLEDLLHQDCFYPAQEGPWGEYLYREVVKTGCDKGSAIRELCSYLGIPPWKTMGFGDGKNDIDMLKTTGWGVAMKDSPAELKAWADSICEAPMGDGIYLELKRRHVI